MQGWNRSTRRMYIVNFIEYLYFSRILQVFAERDLKILEDIQKLQDETKGRESK